MTRGETLARIRRGCGYTRDRLAMLADVPWQTIKAIEEENLAIGIITAQRIFHALSMAIDTRPADAFLPEAPV